MLKTSNMIYILGSFLSLFLLFILWHKQKTKSDYILIIWLLVLTIDLFLYYFKEHDNFFLNVLNVPFPFLHGPLLFLYTKNMLGISSRKEVLIMLIAPLIICLLGLGYLFVVEELNEILQFNEVTSWGVVYFVLVLLSGFSSVAFSLRLVSKYESLHLSNNKQQSKLKWLRLLIFGIGITWCTILLNVTEITVAFLAVFVMALGYYGLVMTPYFIDSKLGKSSYSSEKNTSRRTESVLISQENENEIIQKLEQLIEKKQFLNPNFTQQFVAKKIKTNTAYLSYVVNKYYEQSFSSYLNDLRIKYIIDEIEANPKFREYTTQAIAESAGFKNADSFTISFKKKTGLTPFQYITETKIKISNS